MPIPRSFGSYSRFPAGVVPCWTACKHCLQNDNNFRVFYQDPDVVFSFHWVECSFTDTIPITQQRKAIMSKTTDLAATCEFIKSLSALTNDPTMPSQQQTLLLSLYIHGQVSQSKLEELTGVKASSNSRNIAKLGAGEDRLADNGPKLLENYEDLKNRRTKMVRLTPKGHALLDECWNLSFGKFVNLKERNAASA